MIAGVGIDIIEVERIATNITMESGFRDLVFSQREISYCETKTNKFQHYAARFAAKEAFFKAIGTGWTEGTSFNEVEITNDNTGKPELNLLGPTREALASMAFRKILVSLTHVKAMASAIVIIEK